MEIKAENCFPKRDWRRAEFMIPLSVTTNSQRTFPLEIILFTFALISSLPSERWRLSRPGTLLWFIAQILSEALDTRMEDWTVVTHLKISATGELSTLAERKHSRCRALSASLVCCFLFPSAWSFLLDERERMKVNSDWHRRAIIA